MEHINTYKPEGPRTIVQLHAEMMAADPGCALTLSALRRLVRSGQIKSAKIGTKYIITHGAVSEFLSGNADHSDSTPTIDGIRRIEL